MREYVKKCRNAYASGVSELEYVRCVLENASGREIGENLVWRGTKALVELSVERGLGQFITIEEIRLRSGIQRGQTPTAGLWPWLDGSADVVQKKPGYRAYKIRREFYQAMQQLFNTATPSVTHSIMELQGLGKEIWEGVDPKEYVDRERSSWNG